MCSVVLDHVSGEYRGESRGAERWRLGVKSECVLARSEGSQSGRGSEIILTYHAKDSRPTVEGVLV